jgi:phosphoglycerol transferase MdoB-like AlkP superfamily enzyme
VTDIYESTFRRKIAVHAVAAITPAALAVYSLFFLKSAVTFWWFIDVACLTLVYLAVFFLLPSNRLLRVPLVFLWAGWFVFFHVGNVFYSRFFHTWVHQDIFAQWQDAFGIGSAVERLFTAPDIVYGIAIPMIAAMIAALIRPDIRRTVHCSALFGSGVVLFVAHLIAFGPPLHTRHNEPLLYFIRLPLYTQIEKVQAIRRAGYVKKHLNEFYPYNEADYRRDHGDKGRLTLVPKEGEKGPEKPYNVVLILMESVVAAASGTYGAQPSFTPNIDGMAKDAFVAEQFYANGSQTVRGEFSLLCSFYENLRGGPIYIKYFDKKFRCLTDILAEHKYQTMWISSYKKSYSKKSRFLSRHHVEKMFDQNDLPRPYKKLGWGPSDEDLFASAADRLDQAKEPFFAEIMTLSNHYPFNFNYTSNDTAPAAGTEEYDNYMRGIYYTDYSIGKFMERVRDSEWFGRTIFIITGDHGIWMFPDKTTKGPIEKQEAYFRVPFLIYAPGIVEPGRFTDVASQVDVAPTILDILGMRARNSFVGRSLYRTFPGTRFAFMVHDREWNVRRGDEFCYDVGEECFFDHIPYCEKGHVKDMDKTISCFKFDGDLLRDNSMWQKPPETEKNPRLESFAVYLNSYNSRLLQQNLIYR